MKNLILLLFLSIGFFSFSQQRIKAKDVRVTDEIRLGNGAGNDAAILDVKDTLRGALLPRPTANQIASFPNLDTGLIVYNLDSLYFQQYNGSSWVPMNRLDSTDIVNLGFVAGDNTLYDLQQVYSNGNLIQVSQPDSAFILESETGNNEDYVLVVKNNSNDSTFLLSADGNVIIGDAGLESDSININGVGYKSTFKVSDIDGTNYAQTILHRHSTTLEPLIVGARSNSNNESHSDVTGNQNLFSTYGVGYAGSNYKLFGSTSISADSDGTISNTSSPGKIKWSTTRDGSVNPNVKMVLDNKGRLGIGKANSEGHALIDIGLVSDTLSGIKFKPMSQSEIDAVNLTSSDSAWIVYNRNDSAFQYYDGDTWESFGGGGVDNSVYSVDGVLPENRLIDHNGNTLTFSNGKVKFSSTDNGFVPNKGTTAQMNAISTPETDELFLNTDKSGLYRYDGANWVALAKGYGVIGVITDADNGVPSYYADLQSALETCKTSGSNNTVTLYSDVTITSAINIKTSGSGTGNAYDFESLTIDFNGFKVINNEADGSYCFDVLLGGNSGLDDLQISFINGQVIRTSGTTSARALFCDAASNYGSVSMNKMLWYSDNTKTAEFRLGNTNNVYTTFNDFGGSIFKSDASFAMDVQGASSTYPIKVKNFVAVGNSANIAFYSRGNVEASDFTALNLSTGVAVYAKGTSNLHHFNAYSTSGNAIQCPDDFDGVLSHFYAESTSGDCIYILNGASTYTRRLSNFHAKALTGSVIRHLGTDAEISNFHCENNGASQTIEIADAVDMSNGTAINYGAGETLTVTSNGIGSFNNCTFLSKGDLASTLTCSNASHKLNFFKCTFESRYDNSGGHAVVISDDTGDISIGHCDLVVANASANCVNASSARTIALGNCGLKGATTSINANVTISLTSAPDSNGNFEY